MAVPICVLLPVGGSGTRLRPHTYTRPKPLLRIGGQAMLGHGLDRFLRDLATDICAYIFITPPGGFSEQFVQYISRDYVAEPIHLPDAPPDLRERRARLVAQSSFVVQSQPRGQADALWQARALVDGDPATLVFFPDTIFEADLSALLHLPADVEGALFVKEVADPRPFGVAVTGADGYVTHVVEKPQTPISNKAIVSPTFFSSTQRMFAAIAELREQGKAGLRQGEQYLADAVSLMLADGARLTTLPMPEWVDCGTFEALLAANRYILGRSYRAADYIQAREAVVIVPPVWIDPRAALSRCVVGPNVSIGACKIDAAVITDAILEDGTMVHDAIVRGAVIGRNAEVSGKALSLSIGDDAHLTLGNNP